MTSTPIRSSMEEELQKLRTTMQSVEAENKRLAAALAAERDGSSIAVAGDDGADLEAKAATHQSAVAQFESLLRVHGEAIGEYEALLDAQSRAAAELAGERAAHDKAVAEFFATKESYKTMVAKVGLERCTLQMELSDVRRAAERLAEHERALEERLAEAAAIADQLQSLIDQSGEKRKDGAAAELDAPAAGNEVDELAAVGRQPIIAIAFLFLLGILKGVLEVIFWRRRGVSRYRCLRNWIADGVIRIAAYGEYH